MKIDALRDFVAVAERGSLRAAGRHLGISQPAITRSIQELEKELGTALFERGARGIKLTPIGNAFLKRSRAVHAELGRARDEVDQLLGKLNGQLRLCLSSVAHMALLPNALEPFRRRFPDVVLEIFDGLLPSVDQALKDGTIDLYIGPAFDDPSPELTIEKLFDTNRVVVCRKGHPLAQARSLSELTAAEWVTTSLTPRADQELARHFEQHGLPPPTLTFQAHSALTFLFAITCSDLLMMLPDQWMNAPIFGDALHAIPLVESLPGNPICIVQRNGLPPTPAADYFCTMVRRASLHMGTLIAPPAAQT